MSNELTTFNLQNLPSVSNELFGALTAVSGGSEFLKRIQLITKGKYVDTGKIAPGHWGVPQTGGEEIEDLGVSIDVIPFTIRPKALDVSDKSAIITSYDMESPEFKRIMAAPKNTGCMWGPTFLVLERNTAQLYELFFSNASGRSEAGKLRPFLPGGKSPNPSVATLNIRYKKMPEYGWHVPVITPCSEPITEGPAPAEIVKAIEKFHAMKGGVEKADEAETAQQTKRAR